ncbi:MAG: hypothetical protein HS115_13295 [Spirochaetales bacterium]|nr:hypothetical protein [Spirochaetales bacterium]
MPFHPMLTARNQPVRPARWLAILFLILMVGLPACNPHRHSHYYLYFEEAIDAYYRAPRRPEVALAVMKEACQSFPVERDLSCFNYGLLLEWEKKPDLAVQAYQAAYRIRPDPLYREAARNRGGEVIYRERRSQTLARLLKMCSAGLTEDALLLAGKAQLTRPMLETEPLLSCLGRSPVYYELLTGSAADNRNLGQENREALAQKSPLYPFWGEGRGPVARAWQNYRARPGPGSLQKFYEELAVVAEKDPEREAIARGFRRAAAMLSRQ